MAGNSANNIPQLGDIKPILPVAGIVADAWGHKLGNFLFPAGAYRVRIWVKSFGQTIQVNADTVTHGSEVWKKESGFDHVNQVQDFLGGVQVTAAGNVEWTYDIEYPSASGVNVSAL